MTDKFCAAFSSVYPYFASVTSIPYYVRSPDLSMFCQSSDCGLTLVKTQLRPWFPAVCWEGDLVWRIDWLRKGREGERLEIAGAVQCISASF